MTLATNLFDRTVAQRAVREICRKDRVLAPIVKSIGPVILPRRRPGGAFAYLVRTVVFQQLAIGAAASIHERLVRGVGDDRGRVIPKGLLRAGLSGLRTAGLSRTKARTMLELADAVTRGEFKPHALGRLPDDEVHRRITALRGFGPWSADVFLLFHLGRPDVFPAGDFGLRSAATEIYGGDGPMPTSDLAAMSERWRPYRSAVAWWLWRHKSGRAPGLKRP